MQRTQQLFTIFLASPSDVQKEREIAERVVELVNKSTANRQGWDIKLRLWEDTPPLFGRPQDSINPILDTCDLFIGLLWERWGQPTGGYSSGFEEEFERAKSNRRRSGSPEICLFFKDVEESRTKDPGDQLKKVLEFKKQQIQLNEVKFARVEHSDDWRDKLHLWLPQYLFEFAAHHPEIPEKNATSLSSSNLVGTADIEIAGTSDLTNYLPPQLKSTSETLVSAASSDGLRFFEREGTLSEFEVARLFLLSETLISKRYTNSLIDTHEINLLYKHRNELKPAEDEKLQLIRSFVGESGDVNPGWFWFQDQDDVQAQNRIFELAMYDRADEVRIGALELLTLLKAAIPEHQISMLPIQDESLWVRESAFKLLAEVGDDSTIKFLEEFKAGEKDSWIINGAEDARFRILVRLHPDDALTEAISKDESISSDWMKVLKQNVSNASEAVLLKGLDGSWEQIRQLCLQELSRREKISVEIAKKYSVDSSLPVRAISLQVLAKNGILPSLDLVRKALQDPDPQHAALYGGLVGALGGHEDDSIPKDDAVILSFFRTFSKDNLEEVVNWYSIEGRLAYEALALDHFESIAPTLIQDFTDGFRRIREESLRPVRETQGPEEVRRIEESFENLDQFIGEQFAEAALRGLAKNPFPEGVKIAKSYLKQDTYRARDAALEVVLQFGTSDEVQDLLKMAFDTYGERQKKAALGALKLSSDPLETWRELVLSENSGLSKIAMSWLISQTSFNLDQVLRECLHDKEKAFRIGALSALIRRHEKSEIDDVLTKYIQADSYFYDVVTWLDRILYSPPRLSDAFRNKLIAQGNI